MKKKDKENEGIGIFTIVIIIIIAAIGLYYFFSERHSNVHHDGVYPKVPIDAPAPIPDVDGK